MNALFRIPAAAELGRDFEEWFTSPERPTVIRQWAETIVFGLGATAWECFLGPNGEGSEAIHQILQEGGIPVLAAREIVRCVRAEIRQRQKPLAVFWDLDGTEIPPTLSFLEGALSWLRTSLSAFGIISDFRVYTRNGNLCPKVKALLELEGCELVECPSCSDASTVEKWILVDATMFVQQQIREQQSTATSMSSDQAAVGLCLVTKDPEVGYLIRRLKQAPRMNKFPIQTILMFDSTRHPELELVPSDVKLFWGEKVVLENATINASDSDKEQVQQVAALKAYEPDTELNEDIEDNPPSSYGDTQGAPVTPIGSAEMVDLSFSGLTPFLSTPDMLQGTDLEYSHGPQFQSIDVKLANQQQPEDEMAEGWLPPGEQHLHHERKNSIVERPHSANSNGFGELTYHWDSSESHTQTEEPTSAPDSYLSGTSDTPQYIAEYAWQMTADHTRELSESNEQKQHCLDLDRSDHTEEEMLHLTTVQEELHQTEPMEKSESHKEPKHVEETLSALTCSGSSEGEEDEDDGDGETESDQIEDKLKLLHKILIDVGADTMPVFKGKIGQMLKEQAPFWFAKSAPRNEFLSLVLDLGIVREARQDDGLAYWESSGLSQGKASYKDALATRSTAWNTRPFVVDKEAEIELDIQCLEVTVKHLTNATGTAPRKSAVGSELCTRFPKRFSSREARQRCFDNAMFTGRLIQSGRAGFVTVSLPNTPAAEHVSQKTNDIAECTTSQSTSASKHQATTFSHLADIDLLKTIVRENPRKSAVGNALRLRFPERFPDRPSVKNLLAQAIEIGALAETGIGPCKMLVIPAPKSGGGGGFTEPEVAPPNDFMREEAIRRVVGFLRTMADHDDTYVSLSFTRKMLTSEYKQDRLLQFKDWWLEEAKKEKAIVRFGRPDASHTKEYLCLPDLLPFARSPFARLGTTIREEQHVTKLLGTKGGFMLRKDVCNSLKATFPDTMNTPFRRFLVFQSGKQKSLFYCTVNARGQMVGTNIQQVTKKHLAVLGGSFVCIR